jgi:uncharacterized protein (TIGR03000 family)
VVVADPVLAAVPAAAPAVSIVAKANPNAATVVIKAPTGVRILVDGQETNRNTAEEVFTTPALEPGRTYQYVFKAEAVRDGRTVTDVKRVMVQAGRQAEVDFTDLAGDRGAAEAAKVTVRVPEDAKLYVDNVQCPLTSTSRTFETPKLQPGRRYFYTVRAEVERDGQPVSESRRIYVEAGQTTNVDFKDLGGVQSARR